MWGGGVRGEGVQMDASQLRYIRILLHSDLAVSCCIDRRGRSQLPMDKHGYWLLVKRRYVTKWGGVVICDSWAWH